MKHRLTKATDISPKVKAMVAERDSPRGYIQCVICGSNQANPWCHYIPRSQLGLGIEQNIWSGCNKCHYEYDQTTKRAEYKEIIKKYLMNLYPDWNEQDLIYKKGM